MQKLYVRSFVSGDWHLFWAGLQCGEVQKIFQRAGYCTAITNGHEPKPKSLVIHPTRGAA